MPKPEPDIPIEMAVGVIAISARRILDLVADMSKLMPGELLRVVLDIEAKSSAIPGFVDAMNEQENANAKLTFITGVLAAASDMTKRYVELEAVYRAAERRHKKHAVPAGVM